MRRPSPAVGDVTEGRAAGLAKAQRDVPEEATSPPATSPCGQRRGWGTGRARQEAVPNVPLGAASGSAEPAVMVTVTVTVTAGRPPANQETLPRVFPQSSLSPLSSVLK